MITDVRPKLFDGKWKENVGGGDFTLMFDVFGCQILFVAGFRDVNHVL